MQIWRRAAGPPDGRAGRRLTPVRRWTGFRCRNSSRAARTRPASPTVRVRRRSPAHPDRLSSIPYRRCTMERRARILPGAFLAVFALSWAACADAVTEPGSPPPSFSAVAGGTDYIVMTATETLPADFDAQMRAAGGEVRRAFPQIGLAVVRADAADFEARAKRAPGVKAVFPDLTIQWHEPPRTAPFIEAVAGGDVGETANLGDDETFYSLQWAPGAIRAPAAWAAGYTGRGVRVAVLDGGIHSSHLDLAPNLDVARSTSFVPGVPFNEDIGTFWHGTHVAGIIAAADNGIGTIGIAPGATLIGVKVLHGGSGQFSWVIDGIIYAATP